MQLAKNWTFPNTRAASSSSDPFLCPPRQLEGLPRTPLVRAAERVVWCGVAGVRIKEIHAAGQPAAIVELPWPLWPAPLKRALALSAGPEGQAVPPAAASPWQALPVERKRSLEPSRSSPPPQGPAFGGSRTPSTSDMGEEGRAASGGPTGLETSESLSDSLYDSLSSCGSQG